MATFKIAACDSPPLVTNNSNGQLTGLLPQLANMLIQQCAPNATLEVGRTAKSPSDLHYLNEGREHFVMPFAKSHQFDFQGEDTVFLPVALSPCAYYFVDGEKSNLPIWELLAITWELLLIMILSCGYAGLIIWVFDRSSNNDQFPLSFFHGFWEGVWWSFVTMTTVGYGDRYPKSIPGRIFGMLWILVGIVIISVFTAGLTTALSSEDSGKKIISGKVIAVLEGTEEYATAITMGATVVGYPDLDTLTEQAKIQSKSQSGFLIDSLHALHIADAIQNGHFKLLEKIPRPIVFGILLQGVDSEISTCMHRYVLRKKYALYSKLKEGEKDIPDEVYFHGQDTLYLLLHANEKIVIVYACTLLGLLCLAFTWHVVYWMPRHTKANGYCLKIAGCLAMPCGETPKLDNDHSVPHITNKLNLSNYTPSNAHNQP